MAPMLGITFSLAKTNIAYGIILLLAYGIGHCSVIVIAGTFTEVVQHYLNWNERSKGAAIVKKNLRCSCNFGRCIYDLYDNMINLEVYCG